MNAGVGIGLLVAALGASAAEPGRAPAVRVEALLEAGARTTARMQAGTYAWTVRFGLAHGSDFEVQGVRAAGLGRFQFALEGRGQRFELARVVERDGLWFVHEPDAQGVYRPQEAPFRLPSTYVYWQAAEPRVLTPALAATVGALVGVREHEAVFEAPLTVAARAALHRTVDEARAFAQALPDSPRKRALTESLAPLERRELHGVETRVDVRTGLLTAYDGVTALLLDAVRATALVIRWGWVGDQL